MPTFASLAGLTVAKRLINELDARPGCVAHVHTIRFDISARRTDAGTLVLWGRMNGPTYQHSSRAGVKLERTYVRAADETAAINAQVTRLMHREAAERPLLQAREAVYLLAESRDHQALIPLCKAHPELPADYDQMTLEHCAAWTPLLQALPAAQPTTAAA